MPGFVEYQDLSEKLSYSSFFPSYNQAYFEKTRFYSGAHENDIYYRKTYNVTSQSYQLTTRAFLFHEYGSLAQTLNGGQTLLRWNQYQTDPIILGSPDLLVSSANGVPSTYGSLASRGDLNINNDIGPLNSVATNAVLISSELLKNSQMLLIGGPTHDNQPVFNWSTAPPEIQSIAHKGAPDSWDFDWITMDLS